MYTCIYRERERKEIIQRYIHMYTVHYVICIDVLIHNVEWFPWRGPEVPDAKHDSLCLVNTGYL